SGERLRRVGARDATSGGCGAHGRETTSGGLRQRRDATRSGGLRPVGDPTTGGLRPKGDKLTPHGDGAPAPAALEPVVAAPEGAPLRLFGGVAPTARVGVALAGFGTLRSEEHTSELQSRENLVC